MSKSFNEKAFPYLLQFSPKSDAKSFMLQLPRLIAIVDKQADSFEDWCQLYGRESNF